MVSKGSEMPDGKPDGAAEVVGEAITNGMEEDVGVVSHQQHQQEEEEEEEDEEDKSC